MINTLSMANVVKWLTHLAVNQTRVGSIPIVRPILSNQALPEMEALFLFTKHSLVSP